MVQARLKVIGGKNAEQVVPINGSKFLIGREQDCQLRPNSELVSRHHCVFTLDDYGVRLRDLGSTNGTIVNGERIRGRVELKTGDRVSVGKLEFEVEVLRGAETAADQAAAAPIELPVSSEETAELSSGETQFELQIPPALNDPNAPGGDTAIIDPAAQQPAQPLYAPAPMPGYPPPGMPQPMGYPAYYPQQYPQQYPQPGYYPQPGMPYPQQMPMQAPPAPAPPEDTGSSPVIRLPDPASTGAELSEPKAAGGEDTPAAGGEEANPSNTAAEIIRRRMSHRTPGE